MVAHKIALSIFLVLITISARCNEKKLTRLSIPSGKYIIDALTVSQKGVAVKNAIIFIGGSGEWEIVDSYLKDPVNSYSNMLAYYVEEKFLDKGVMIVYLNKRGIGKSTGHWRKGGIEQRADDVSAAVEFIKTQYTLSDNQIGLVGHSQGCWVAQRAAVRNKKLNFIINMAGSFMGVYEQTLVNDMEMYKCDRLNEKQIKKKQFWRQKELGLGKAIGKIIGGEAGYWARLAEYDSIKNHETLCSLQVPALFILSEHDLNVPQAPNYAYARKLFAQCHPMTIELYEQKGIDHNMHQAESPCDPYPWTLNPVPPMSEELRDKLNSWISERLSLK